MKTHGLLDARTRARLRRRLLAWYDREKRALPWRETRDPYAIWVSETMLQQTQVATVIDYYRRWMARFPSLESLSRADEQDVLAQWQGLGYYSRARNLHRGAQRVVRDGGRLPADPDALRKLPGIGPYTAGAIASIAFDRPAPLVDGNVARVLCRLLEIESAPKASATARSLWSAAGELVRGRRPGDLNQALMELGATVCTPVSPRCASCPVAALCGARAAGRTAELPAVAPRQKTVRVRRVAAVLERRGRVLARKVEDDPRWRGLWLFPTTDVAAGESVETALKRLTDRQFGVEVARAAPLCTVRHAFTHHRIELHAFRCSLSTGTRVGALTGARWYGVADLAALPLPAPYRKIARALGDDTYAQ